MRVVRTPGSIARRAASTEPVNMVLASHVDKEDPLLYRVRDRGLTGALVARKTKESCSTRDICGQRR
jgi:hypothetical protein